MMHANPAEEPRSGDPVPDRKAVSRREALARVEAWTAHVANAKRIADESLARVSEAPGPHATTNTIFVALYEEHQCDRERLFEAMRSLEVARAELRAAGSGYCEIPEAGGRGRG